MEDSSRKLRMKMHYILKSKIASYILLTFSVSYGYVFVYYIFGGRLSGVEGLLFAVSYMFIPSVCSFILQRFIYKEPLKELGLSFPIKKSWMWFLIAWILPAAIASVTIFSSLLIPGVHFSQGMEGLFEKYRSLLTPEQLSQMHNSLNTMPIHPFFLGIILCYLRELALTQSLHLGKNLVGEVFFSIKLKRGGYGRHRHLPALSGAYGMRHLSFKGITTLSILFSAYL